LYYTASGIITPIGALHSLWYHHTYRCDDTRGCVIQFWPPDDEHMCSKHVEAWNKLIVKQKFCTSSWLITEIKKRNTSPTRVLAICSVFFAALRRRNMQHMTPWIVLYELYCFILKISFVDYSTQYTKMHGVSKTKINLYV